MNSVSDLKKRYYKSDDHPYQIYERKIESLLKPDYTLLDAGCGRSAPVLKRFENKAGRLIGIDLEDPEDIEGIDYRKGDIANIPVVGESVDIVISRAVLEHVKEPEMVFREIARILKKDGHFIFLIPNLWDYASLISLILPNKYHPQLVSVVEGRKVNDTFPAYYKVNTRFAVSRIASKAGFNVETFSYLGQYPSYMMFNPFLFMMGIIYEKTVSKIKPLNFLNGWILADLKKM